MNQEFYVEALWDEDAQVYYSKSDIPGLNIEAGTLGEFEEFMHELAPVLLIENVLKPALEAVLLKKNNHTELSEHKPTSFDQLPPVNFMVPSRPVNFAHA